MSALRKPGQFAADPRRRVLIAKIHVAKKQLAMADDDYVEVLLRAAGRRSSAECTDAELVKVIQEMQRLGFVNQPAVCKPTASRGPRPSDKPFARKARAMWISLHHLCVVRSPAEEALEAFACRQLDVAKMQWADESLSYRLIEALKDMAERNGWSQALPGVKPEARVIVLKRRLVEAILGKMWQEGLVPLDWDVERAAWELAGTRIELLFASASDLDVVAGAFGRKLRAYRAAAQ